jgi:glycosyltransferase involved in cell wall biosynthesis
MSSPKISVILPVYNAELYLNEAIESILNQTITDFEFIIINDGSTDNSENIINSYKDNRIKYISNSSNLKIIKTLNIGVDLAKGKYISRMDADDIALPNMFEKQLEVFENKRDVDIVNVQTYIMSNNGESYRKSKTVIKVNNDVHQHIVFFQNLISHPGVMIKSILLKKHRYNENEIEIPFQDVDLWYRILKSGANCFTTDDWLLYYRNTTTGITNTKREGRQIKRLKYCKEILSNNYFNFFADKEIAIILGNYKSVNYKTLISLNKNLDKYITHINLNKNISLDGLSDLKFWKTHLIFFSSIKSLNNKKMKEFFLILLFILSKIFIWISNNKWRKNFIDVLISKRFKTQNK